MRSGRRAVPEPAAEPLDDAEIDELAACLEALPEPCAPLDVSALDGFLCGVLVQPAAIPFARWFPFVLDEDGRALPPGHDLGRLRQLVERRVAEIRRAILRRAWFDPWVFTPESEAEATAAAVAPWVVGLAGALGAFPALLQDEGPELDAALAPAFRWLDRAELEDADGLFEAIEGLPPAASLEEAVEGLVRSTLLLADVAGLPEAAVRR